MWKLIKPQRLKIRINPKPFSGELFNREQLTQHARLLGAEQQTVGSTRNNFLREQLDYNDEVLHNFNNEILVGNDSSHTTPATEWLLDNFYLIEEHILLARYHYPKRYNMQLPSLLKGGYKELPRVYSAVIELISHTDAQVDEESLHVFFEAYQTGAILKIGELWAIPIMLRLALIENLQRIATRLQLDQKHREIAKAWVDKLEDVVLKKPSKLIEIVSDMAKTDIPLSGSFVSEFSQRLSSQNSALQIARNWLEQRLAEDGLFIDELIYQENQDQAANQLSVSHSINSLRYINTSDWKIFVENQSGVEHILLKDPAEIYGFMDFNTRDHYRHIVESLAQKSPCTEIQVAEYAITLAQLHRDTDNRHQHVGYYLVGDGKYLLNNEIEIESTIGSRIRENFRRFPLNIYMGSIAFLSILGLVAFAYSFQSPEMPLTNGWFIALSLLFFICISQFSVFFVNWLITLLAEPDVLPRLDFSKRIPVECRTMVIIPSFLSNQKNVDHLIGQLELHFLANRNANLYFGLLTDFVDSTHETESLDNLLLSRASTGIDDLNKKYAAEENTLFYLFHRPRFWNAQEQAWIGYERKRGKLMQFNALLRGGSASCFSLIKADSAVLPTIKYVITLDTDTQLSPETAHKLISTMAHPLNQPEFDPRRNVVVRGYGVLQPRVSSNLVSSQCSLFSRLFTRDSGVDIYTRAVSDVYQDVFHEGSYVGKGIYDVDAFNTALNNRFPENKILSHDLLESAYVRSALVGDVEVTESFPSGYDVDANRRYRWMRGDWQIIQWLLPWVPSFGKGLTENSISGLSKWKIFDNLRRSIVSPATLLFLIGFSILFPQELWLGLVLILLIATMPFLFENTTNTLRKAHDQSWKQHLREVVQKGRHQMLQVLFSLVVLPYEAYLCTKAIALTFWRLTFSHKHFLQWQSFADAEHKSENSASAFYKKMWFSPAMAFLCGISLGAYNPVLLYVLPFLLVWIIAPYLAKHVSSPVKQKASKITQEQQLLLHKIARKTWHFFEVFVNEKHNWLPPDNYQEIPTPRIASRTSPTNIGLSLLSNLSAYDLGYLSAGKLVERTASTLDTITKLKKHKGHLYNWYNTETLDPMLPLYVSSVDSGNLAGHLLTLSEGLKGLKETKIYDPVVFAGLLDTVRLMRSIDDKNNKLILLEKKLSEPLPETLSAAFNFMELLERQIEKANDSFLSDDFSLCLWGEILMDNCKDHMVEMDLLAPWLKEYQVILAEKQGKGINAQHSNYIAAILKPLETVPTLKEVANLENTACLYLESILHEQSARKAPLDDDGAAYMKEWIACLKDAATNAKQRLQMLDVLALQSESFANMDFAFLYNPAKKLFTIGYNVAEQRLDTGSYDMLASEARLCSYVAIAQGQIPLDHWFSLSRLLILSQGKPILVSWSGSMFEYLMPLLVMPNYGQTLLDQTYKGIVHEQIEYGNTFNVPWGISESGLNRIDTHFNYQYKAFGIPSLGLKRGLSKELVIAPYATLLALMVNPRKACENVERLSAAGYEGDYGYYEAIDYTPAHLPLNETSITIHSYMAHHQGMGLLSIANLMNDNLMQKRFMACPMIKAFELLLQEKVPHNVTTDVISDDSKFEIKGINPLFTDSIGRTRFFDDKNIAPEVNILSNGRYQLMVNNSGGGYSRWNNLAVTRWREDAVAGCWGLFIYLRDTDTGEYWSVGNQPITAASKEYKVKFTQAYAEFEQRYSKLAISTTICVSPEDDIELRRITLTNYTNKPRTIELTTYSEVVIAPQDADEAHPAFSNLFVQTRFNAAASSIFCTRRPRSQDENPPHLLHLMVADHNQANDISCETDRSRFVGRGHGLSNPLAMQQTGALSNSEGSVLDPVVALRRTVVIPPGKKVNVFIALGMSDSQAGATALSDKYQNSRMADRAFELAWTHSHVALYQLNTTESQAQVFSKMASSLVYMNSHLRADSAILKNNKRGQSSLWSYGISGDIPVVLLRISDMANIELVRQLILAHAYWRTKGLKVDLVILNEDISLYRQSLYDEIINLVAGSMEAPLLDKQEGIFVRRTEYMPYEDILLLQSVARIVVSDEKGSLSEQIEGGLIIELKTPLLRPERTINTANKVNLPPPHLLFRNGLGGFAPDGNEYVISLTSDADTPAPWCNVLANEHFGTVVSESGSAYTWGENAHEFRLTPWNNDTVEDKSGEAFYIRDEETGQYWSPTPSPARGVTPYVIRHGFGYTVFEHTENDIKSEFWIYVALDASVKFSILKVTNLSERTRKISATGYYEWILADRKSKSLLHLQTEIDIETGVLFARNLYNPDFAGKIAFIDVNGPRTVTGDRKEFIGQNSNLSHPEAMKRTRLSGRTGAGFDACGAVQVSLELAGKETKDVRFKLGFAHDKQEMKKLVLDYRYTGASEDVLAHVRNYWNRTLHAIGVDTPDASINVMANGWLLYQTLSSRVWARSGFYQSGGAYGFRDQLQDVMALVHTAPEICRQQILRCAAHQFTKGDVQHWWHPPMNRGVRTHFSDDYLWLPYVACHYMTSVGDKDILDEVVSFIEGRDLGPDEESYYDQINLSSQSATLYEHCVRSIRYGLKFGVHGLPLMGCGDWNDGMNLVGRYGKGESVWLAFFLYDVLVKFSDVAKGYGDQLFANECTVQAEKLRKNIQLHAWDGEWYLRAFFDDGSPLGSSQNNECRIDSIAQSWSVISGAGDKERSDKAMNQVGKQLVDRENRLIRLFTPSFDTSPLNPGYIKGYIPGVRENGGQYTHAAIWTAWAFAMMGETDKAWELLELLNPVQHGATAQQIAIYKVEPYVVAADVYSNPQHIGRGGWTWYTGSASWMYRLLVEVLLGINRSGNRLHLTPHLKTGWNSYKAHYNFQETIYHITIHRITDSTEPYLMLDGVMQNEVDRITMENDCTEHAIDMWV
jgi:cyclic beta-1,2-glucan synthetase